MNNKTYFRPAGHIRIIGGRWRGRKLPVPERQGLRPTTNRVRETLFNWLEPVIQGAHCLDCFAGSGALGLESLSRAAASVILLEKDRAVSAQLTKNLHLLQAPHAKIITADSLQWLAQPGTSFDVVFIDPPFYKGMIDQTITLLEQYSHLADEAWIYIETETNGIAASIPTNWQPYQKSVAGKVESRLYFRHAIPKKD